MHPLKGRRVGNGMMSRPSADKIMDCIGWGDVIEPNPLDDLGRGGERGFAERCQDNLKKKK